MFARSVIAAAALLVIFTAGARASDASDIGKEAGFLLGNAYRCGTRADDLLRSAAMVRRLLRVAAIDSDDAAAAESTFSDTILTSALSTGDQLARCTIVRAALRRLERHAGDAARLAGRVRLAEARTAGERRPTKVARANRRAQAAKQRNRKQPENARAEQPHSAQREATALRLAAKEFGKPPTI